MCVCVRVCMRVCELVCVCVYTRSRAHHHHNDLNINGYGNNGTLTMFLTQILLNYQFGDERGMGGMAFHPDFARNGRIFVYYNLALSQADRLRLRGKLGLRRWDHKSRLSEMRQLPGRRDLVDPEWERVLLEVDQPYANHNGGEVGIFGVVVASFRVLFFFFFFFKYSPYFLFFSLSP